MNDTSIYALAPAQQLEIETLRDQRDLYRSLLLSEIDALGLGLTQALASVETLRSLLRAPTRDDATFRGKLERLLAELDTLTEALQPLHLPSAVGSRVRSSRCARSAPEARSPATICCPRWSYSEICAATSRSRRIAPRCTCR
jgi:hypothetical protein